MLVLAHTGITLGAVVLLAGSFSRGHSLAVQRNRISERSQSLLEPVSYPAGCCADQPSWMALLASQVDMRLLLLGSLVPDIIDKPVGQFLFRDTFGSGRIFGHTLLFLVLVILIGLYFYQCRGKSSFLVPSVGILAHLVLDQMWRSPQTLLWPVYGFTFDRADLTRWLSDLLNELLTRPEVYMPELVGAAVLFWLWLVLIRRGAVMSFVRSGKISGF